MTSAKIMQRTNVLIMPLVFASFICGFLSEYEQVRRENGGIVITHRQNETNYFLREFSYADKK